MSCLQDIKRMFLALELKLMKVHNTIGMGELYGDVICRCQTHPWLSSVNHHIVVATHNALQGAKILCVITYVCLLWLASSCGVN